MNNFLMSILIRFLLHLLAMQFNFRKSRQKILKSNTGWIDFSLGIRTENNKVHAAISFQDGKTFVYSAIPDDADTLLIFKDEKALYDMITLPPNEIFNLLLKNKMRTKGNLAYLNAFNFYISLFMGKKHKKLLIQAKEADKKKRLEEKEKYKCTDFNFRKKNFLKGAPDDKGVKYLEDPYLSQYGLDDFPRIKKFLDIHFT